MPTTITGTKVTTDETDTDTLSGGLTNSQLVRGLLDGDLALDANGNIIVENSNTIAHTDAKETVSRNWTFNSRVTVNGDINLAGTQPGVGGGENTVIGMPDPTSAEHAANKRYVDNFLDSPQTINELWNFKQRVSFHHDINMAGSGTNPNGSTNTIVGVPDPNSAEHAANKRYVDNATGGATTQTVGGMSVIDDNNNVTRLI